MPDNAEFASFVRQRSCDQPTECCELLAQRLMLYPVPIRCAAALRTLLPLNYPYRCLQAALDYFTAVRFSNAFAFQKYPATGAARSAANSSNYAAEISKKTRPPPERATAIDERREPPPSSNGAPCVRATSFTGTSRKRQREDQPMDEEEPARARTYTKVLLGVDKRERLHGKHSEMEKAATAEGAFEECVSVTLPIGDFVFLTRDPDDEGGALRVFPIVVERKTVSDLLSSVVSSRLAMQKTILQRSPFHVLCLLIEGNIEGGHVGPSSSSLHHHHSDAHALRCSSSMTSTMVRDGIAVVRTKDSHGTVEWLRRCATELEQQQQQQSSRALSPLPLLNDVVQHVVSIRAEFEVRSIAVRMLSAVHGISANFAEQILRCVHAHHTCIPPTGTSDETASMVHLADVLSQLGQPASSSSSTGGREIVPAAQRFYAQLAQLPKSQVQRRGLAILAELFGATAYH